MYEKWKGTAYVPYCRDYVFYDHFVIKSWRFRLYYFIVLVENLHWFLILSVINYCDGSYNVFFFFFGDHFETETVNDKKNHQITLEMNIYTFQSQHVPCFSKQIA